MVKEKPTQKKISPKKKLSKKEFKESVKVLKTGIVKKKKPVNPLRKVFISADGNSYKVTVKERKFCEMLIMTEGNRIVSALEAYDITNKELYGIPNLELSPEQIIKKRKAENVAARIGMLSVRKVHIVKYIDYLLVQNGFTDEVITFEHFRSIKQDDSWSDKLKGIDLYYKVKKKYDLDPNNENVNQGLKDFLNMVAAMAQK